MSTVNNSQRRPYVTSFFREVGSADMWVLAFVCHWPSKHLYQRKVQRRSTTNSNERIGFF